jgi:hypothetical protein
VVKGGEAEVVTLAISTFCAFTIRLMSFVSFLILLSFLILFEEFENGGDGGGKNDPSDDTICFLSTSMFTKGKS